MLFSNAILAHCEHLSRLGFSVPFKAGNLIARGFADVGYEVFCLLPNHRAVSLFTGEQIAFDAAESRHFFSVPDCDLLLSEIDRCGAEIIELLQVQRWQWQLKMQVESRAELLLISGDSLLEVFLNALQSILQGS